MSDGQYPPAADTFDDAVTGDSPDAHPPHPPTKAYGAVFRALNRLWHRLDALRHARATNREGKIENLAEDCVHLWLIAQAARRRLEQQRVAQDWALDSARDAVDGAAQLLRPELRPMRHLPTRTKRHLARLALSMRLVE